MMITSKLADTDDGGSGVVMTMIMMTIMMRMLLSVFITAAKYVIKIKSSDNYT